MGGDNVQNEYSKDLYDVDTEQLGTFDMYNSEIIRRGN